jgi:hypothetical protein
MDVAVAGGKIAAVAKDSLRPRPEKLSTPRAFECHSRLIDIHVHVGTAARRSTGLTRRRVPMKRLMHPRI